MLLRQLSLPSREINKMDYATPMTKIGLLSEDRTLHALLSSALGKAFEVHLESDGDRMEALANSRGCDVLLVFVQPR